MKPLFSFTCQVDKHAIKKNSKAIYKNRRTGASFIASNPGVKVAEDKLVFRLKIEKLKSRIDFPIEDDVIAKITFQYPKSVYYTKKGDRSNRVGDISNLYQIVEDALQKAEVIKNDSQIVGHDGSRRVAIDGNQSFLIVEIFKCDQNLQTIRTND